MSNRSYPPAYLAKGERALLLRALRVFMHEQQVMISQAHAQYAAKRPEVFADHKQHHQKQIDAAAALFERFRTGAVNSSPSRSSSI